MGKRVLTKRTRAGETRAKVLAFVRERVLAGFPPTVREVQEAFGFRAVESAREHLEKLVASGALEKEAGLARGYRLPARADDEPRMIAVPLLGRVPAGPLAEAIEEREGWIAAEPRGGAEIFALIARGHSMRDAGIESGDVLLVRAQVSADDGDIVVARVDGEATVKRLRLRRGRASLLPENPAYAPIEIAPGSDFAILGRVIEVRRIFDRA